MVELTSPAPRTNNPAEAKSAQALHRIRAVRLQQGVSLRTAARHMKTDVRQIRLQEQESTDLRISDLHKWQKALDVPITDLLEETDAPLSRPVMERARMIRLMKTAAAIKERAEATGIQRMADMLIEQLCEIMPELEDVSPWHDFGQRRSLDEYGRVVDRRLSDDLLCSNRSQDD